MTTYPKWTAQDLDAMLGTVGTMHLQHLEEEWPEKLERLLKSGGLPAHLVEVDRKTSDHIEELLRQNPGMTDEEAQEIAQAVWALESNPAHDPDTPKSMGAEGKKLLREFRKELDAQA